MTYEKLWKRLTPLYEAGEAKAIVRWMLDVRFGLSMADILCGKISEMTAGDQKDLETMMTRLVEGEPVQYVVGRADFCGRLLHVGPGVLIPRPETAELCQWVFEEKGNAPVVLDIGTGCGCIAITLAAEMPEAKVTGWDISGDALRIAKENARSLNVDVAFEQRDILDLSVIAHHLSLFDIIVSNPPYICQKEEALMERNVLDYEPRQALFVPDDDPLLFYRVIARFAIDALKTEGSLYFELNPLYALDTAEMMRHAGFDDIELRHDQYGKQRFLKATKI